MKDLYPETEDVCRLKNIVKAAGAARDLDDPRLVWPPVVVFAMSLEDERRLEQALDALDTALTLSDGRDGTDEVFTHLQRGRVLLLCSRPQEAYQAYADAEAMAARMGDSEACSELLGCVGRGAALRDLNRLTEAVRVLARARQDAEQQGHPHAEARASRELAVTYERTGRRPEAAALLYRAFELLSNPRDQGPALCDLGAMLQTLGWNDAAQDALGFVADVDNACECRVQIRAMLKLLDVTALSGNRIGFEMWSRRLQALTDKLELEQLVGFQSSLGAGYARFGRIGAATERLENAVELAKEHDLFDSLERAESLLARVSGGESLGDAPGDVEFAEAPDLVDVAERLRGLGSR